MSVEGVKFFLMPFSYRNCNLWKLKHLIQDFTYLDEIPTLNMPSGNVLHGYGTTNFFSRECIELNKEVEVAHMENDCR